LEFKNEKEMYSVLEEWLENRDHYPVSARKRERGERGGPKGVDVYDKVMQVDLVRFRRLNDWDMDAIDVECKINNRTQYLWQALGEALGQATAYQRLFSQGIRSFRDLRKRSLSRGFSLHGLGLGYIEANYDRATEIFPPGHNIRFNKREFDLQVFRKAAVFLVFNEFCSSVRSISSRIRARHG